MRIKADSVRRPGESGVILIVLVVGITVMLIMLGVAAQSWNTVQNRDREKEFISRARQYVDACQRYQTDQGKLPTTLSQLYEPGPKGNSRYVRKKWKDPLTGRDWVLLWLAPDNASLFRSDGRASTSGNFRNAPGATPNMASALNIQDLTKPYGSKGSSDPWETGGAGRTRELFNEASRNKGKGNDPNRAFADNPDFNLSGFDTGSDLMHTAGIGPIVGVATSFTGKPYLEWRGQKDYAGYEVSIFSFQDDRQGPKVGGPVDRNLWESSGLPTPDPQSPEGRKLLNTDADTLSGRKR